METLADFVNATTEDRAKFGRERGWRTHKGPDNWEHDIATSNRRALASISAQVHNLPRPVYGTHRGESRNA